MKPPPSFDPYELLGVDIDADAASIDRAYKARIRLIHPDVAGDAGLVETKRLNVAREWLLDPELRARLPRRAPRWSAFAADASRRRDRSQDRESQPREAPPEDRPGASSESGSSYWDGGPSSGGGSSYWDGGWGAAEGRSARGSGPRAAEAGSAWGDAARTASKRSGYDPERDDPITFDYGPDRDRVLAFLASVRALSVDERARLTYSMGDEPPASFSQHKQRLGDVVWSRSRALHDACLSVWDEREDEVAPYDFPRTRFHGGGPAIANAYGQWLLLGPHLRLRPPDGLNLERLAYAATWPWDASVGQPRYGSSQAVTAAFLRDARTLPVTVAERLARSWERDMSRTLYGTPGEDWFPGTRDHAKPDLVSARLAAVDASRVPPPEGLSPELRRAFQAGLRLTAYVLAIGGVDDPRRDYLRPWKDAMDANPSFMDRARHGLPLG